MGETLGDSGINYFGFLAQSVNFLFLFIWVAGGLRALFSIKKRQLTSTVETVWVLLVILVPAVGVIAFWIVNPQGLSEAS